MRFDLDGIEVFFPYDYLYPEQYDYMRELKRSLDAKGHCLLEMPTGTGKTVSLLSLITSYQYARPGCGKLIYCTRTVPEMLKCMEELKTVIAYRQKCLGEEGGKLLAVSLSSRRNMCIHPKAMAETDREGVDAQCRSMTASWVRARAAEGEDIETCPFFEQFDRMGSDVMPNGIYSLDDLRDYGKEKGWCPYFLARRVILYANVVVYNYQYMLDPKIAGMISREMEKESIVVFDEAHNIDNVCLEALSVQLNNRSLNIAARNLTTIGNAINRLKQADRARLDEEYRRLIEGLRSSGDIPGGSDGRRGGEELLASPVLPQDLLDEAIPGNIRRAEHFISFMRRLVEYLRQRIRVQNVESESPLAFLYHLNQATSAEAKQLKFCYSRLNSLLRTLEVTNLDEFNALTDVADFATLVATYSQGFMIIIEPYNQSTPNLHDPVLQLACLDSSLAIKPVFERFSSVIITSGTLSPIDLYPKLLNFNPMVRESLPMTVYRPCICPLVVTRGSDQVPISSRFDIRDDISVVRNYGALLIEIAKYVPDGVVCFFPSYIYMEGIVSQWDGLGILKKVLEHKLLFIETKDVVETTLALDNFKRACDCGRGAIFLSVARGKVAEGIDFDRHYGRCVVLFGVPFQYTLSHILRARLDYLRDTHQIREGDFLSFDALRQAAQCVGRVIRSKTDYGLMIFADQRYNRHDKRSKLPPWINQFLGDAQLNLSTDMAISIAKNFLKQMAQPVNKDDLMRILLSEDKVRQLTKKEKALEFDQNDQNAVNGMIVS